MGVCSKQCFFLRWEYFLLWSRVRDSWMQHLLCFCLFLAGTLQLERALVVKLCLAQRMQISPKIPPGSNDELLMNIQANNKPLCVTISLGFLVTVNSAMVQPKCSLLLLTVSNKPVKSCPSWNNYMKIFLTIQYLRASIVDSAWQRQTLIFYWRLAPPVAYEYYIN